jgi:hypothetical protein
VAGAPQHHRSVDYRRQWWRRPELGVEVVEGAKSPKIEEVGATAGDAVGVSRCRRRRGRGRQVGGGVGIKGKKGVVRKKSSRREKPSGKKEANMH